MLGPSGTGKSVFLKTLVGLLKPDAGSIVINGRDLTRLREADLYEVRKLFGVLFQDGALFGSMTLYDNVAFPLREHTKKTEAEIKRIVSEKMDLVGLSAPRASCPARSPAACASAPAWPARWCSTPRSCSSTSPTRASTRCAPPTSTSSSSTSTPRSTRRSSSSRTTSTPLAPCPTTSACSTTSTSRCSGPREMLLSSEEPVVRQFLNAQTRRPDRHVGGEGRRRAGRRGSARSSRRCRPSPLQLRTSDGTPRRAERAGRRLVPRQRRHPSARLVPVRNAGVPASAPRRTPRPSEPARRRASEPAAS